MISSGSFPLTRSSAMWPTAANDEIRNDEFFSESRSFEEKYHLVFASFAGVAHDQDHVDAVSSRRVAS